MTDTAQTETIPTGGTPQLELSATLTQLARLHISRARETQARHAHIAARDAATIEVQASTERLESISYAIADLYHRIEQLAHAVARQDTPSEDTQDTQDTPRQDTHVMARHGRLGQDTP